MDPIPELAARVAEPFYWHEIGDLVEHTPEIDRYLAAMKASGIGDGLALNVFGPGLRNAYVGLGFAVERLNLPPSRIARLQCIVQTGHLRFCALNDRLEQPAKLTMREREVLRWIAMGKSNSVIASLLRISPHTVDAHLRSIYRKLHVADRTSAAVRGLGIGLLQYPDPLLAGPTPAGA